MYNIVIATDLQPETENALLRALQLSEEHSAKLYIFHVASRMLDNINETTSIEDWSKDVIQTLVKKYPTHKKVDYEICIVRGGRIQDQIDNFSRNLNADLVIMGADRSTINAPEAVRTKIEHVLWQGDYPVLAVFKDIKLPYKNILVISQQYRSNLLKFIFKNYDDKLDRKLVKRIRRLLNNFSKIASSSSIRFLNDMPAGDILSTIKQNPCDLLVWEIVTKDISRPDLGKNVHDIITDETCDVLLMKKE